MKDDWTEKPRVHCTLFYSAKQLLSKRSLLWTALKEANIVGTGVSESVKLEQTIETLTLHSKSLTPAL